MTNPKNLRFPLTLEAFTAFQEADMGRKAAPMERELFAEVVDLANAAYTAACVFDTGTIKALLDTVEAVDNCPENKKLCGLCRGWILEGCKRGLELLVSTGDVLPS